MRKAINKALAGLGYQIVKTSFTGAAHRLTMEGALGALARKGYAVATVVDIGASDGRWTESALEHFPQARYLLIEAQERHRAELAEFQRRHPNVRFVIAAAGERVGRIRFDSSDPFGGQATESPTGDHADSVPVTTLDREIREGKFPAPYLLKFDTHGFEPPILRGASEVLRQTSVIIMEAYNFRISSECMVFHEMCAYLAQQGFRCVDLVDPMHRPYDDNLWQMDLVFVRDDRPEFRHLAYR